MWVVTWISKYIISNCMVFCFIFLMQFSFSTSANDMSESQLCYWSVFWGLFIISLSSVIPLSELPRANRCPLLSLSLPLFLCVCVFCFCFVFWWLLFCLLLFKLWHKYLQSLNSHSYMFTILLSQKVYQSYFKTSSLQIAIN